VRQIMEYYLAVRMRRLGRTYGPGVEPTRPLPSPYLRGGGAAPSPVGAGTSGSPASISGQTRLGTVRSSSRPPSGRPTSRY
jgi:hypothetical protein